ncbi:hypothetical protein CRG98_005141 [Punica granatum]|uniref:Uncharacterized protein n=1 Tax=Punica granatum TaxID=22663 RepID=A0A2I0L168_PUNGR|nr:hypothetical protein CRG98_005141 [Punica granatum]
MRSLCVILKDSDIFEGKSEQECKEETALNGYGCPKACRGSHELWGKFGPKFRSRLIAHSRLVAKTNVELSMCTRKRFKRAQNCPFCLRELPCGQYRVNFIYRYSVRPVSSYALPKKVVGSPGVLLLCLDASCCCSFFKFIGLSHRNFQTRVFVQVVVGPPGSLICSVPTWC